MKNLKSLLIVFLSFFIARKSNAQAINWKTLRKEDKQLAMFDAGLNYGLVIGAGYGYQLKTSKPLILNVNISIPFGENMLDDFKTRLGGQINLYKSNNIFVNASLHGIYRRNQNAFVRLQNFGAEVSSSIGYYKLKWFSAIEIGFDKAIITHFKHTALYKENYPGVQDGWYEPATGGNFLYGIQLGYSFKHSDITLHVGKLLTQDFTTKPLIPYYIQLGYNLKIGRAIAKEKRPRRDPVNK